LKIVAILCVRNGELYLRRCLDHLSAQGVDTCVIDNDSTDGSLAIAESCRGRGVVRIEHLPFDGVFRFTDILRRKEALARELEADWLMHCDVDEIRQAPSPWSTLAEGIAEVDRQGFNAINFDEFVFLPAGEERFEGADFVAEMRHYYYFHPAEGHRINAWKNIGPVDLVTHSGHRVEFPGRRVYPESFILRHYVALSRVHALAKYATRVHDADRIRRTSWNAPRVAFRPAHLRLPERSELTEYRGDDVWDRSRPWTHHPFLGPPPAPLAPAASADSLPTVPPPQRAGWRPRRLFSRRRAEPDPETAPLPFIVGSPRSGTTLLRLMLDAHPLLTIPPETHFLPDVLGLTGAGEAVRRAFFHCIVGGPRWNDFHLSEESFERRLQEIEPFDLTRGIHAFYRMYGERQHKPRWGDKTPGYVLHLRKIAAVLPTARFIHLIRDGRDVAASLRKLWWGPGDDIEAQAIDWLWRIREARQQAQVCPHYLEIRYEDLVRDPRATLEKVCGFLDLPYTSAILEYHRRAGERLDELSGRPALDGGAEVTVEQLHEIHARTRLPVNDERVGRWRQDLTAAEIAVFQQIAGPFLRELGYEGA
jgi:glycosyltransferase involved in cell wall biosynthesis